MPDKKVEEEFFAEDRSLGKNITDGFLAWQKHQKRVKRFRWIIPILIVGFGYILVITLLSEIETGLTPWGWFGAFSLIAVYVWYVVGSPLYERQRLREHSVIACIYTAHTAKLYLEKRNPLTASLSLNTLLLALSHFLSKKSVTMGKDTVALRDIMSVVPEEIPRRAVFKAIQANKDTRDFQRMLDELLTGLMKWLGGDKDAGYIATNEFLARLHRRIEAYRQISQTLRDKHPTMVAVAKVMERIVLPPLVVIVIEVMRRFLFTSA